MTMDFKKRAEDLMPMSRTYFSDPLSWPETREVFIRSIEQALKQVREETIDEIADLIKKEHPIGLHDLSVEIRELNGKA